MGPSPVPVQVYCESFHTVSYKQFVLGPCSGKCHDCKQVKCHFTSSLSVVGVGEPWLLGQPSAQHGKDSLLSWLQSEDLLSVLSTTVSDIHTTVNKAKEDGKSMDINTCYHQRV